MRLNKTDTVERADAQIITRSGGGLYSFLYGSPLGGMEIVCGADGLTGLRFIQDGKACGAPIGLVKDAPPGVGEVLRQTVGWLDIYFGGGIPDFVPPLKLNGSPFCRRVWDILLTVPYGKTVTYGQIAAEVARAEGKVRSSARAVGGAVGKNPVAVIVPCHRVIGADGSLTGYASGLAKKLSLLKIESVLK